MPPHIVVCGPAAWNHLILLDHLPEPIPHMQFAEHAWHTLGGTSAGKALHLSGRGVDVRLIAPIGTDDEGERALSALTGAGVRVEALASARTERHVNLMTDRGERVSLYVATPSPPSPEHVESAASAAAAAGIAVIDLSELGAALLGRTGDTPLWIDLHDYDGSSAFHEPFLRAADVVFMNDDDTGDVWRLMQSCLERGPRLAVCTRGADGAVALAADGERYSVAADPVDVIDTNGAGDAFMAGFLAATIRDASVDEALRSGVAQARIALGTRHLHPLLDAAV